MAEDYIKQFSKEFLNFGFVYLMVVAHTDEISTHLCVYRETGLLRLFLTSVLAVSTAGVSSVKLYKLPHHQYVRLCLSEIFTFILPSAPL